MIHCGSNAEWKVGMGYLGYFVAMAIRDIKTPLPPPPPQMPLEKKARFTSFPAANTPFLVRESYITVTLECPPLFQVVPVMPLTVPTLASTTLAATTLVMAHGVMRP